MGRGLLWIPLSGSRGWRVSCRACLSVCWRHWKSAAVVWLRGRHSSIVCCRENSVVCWELVNTSMFAHPKVRLYSQLVEGSLGLNSSFWTITIIIIIITINTIMMMTWLKEVGFVPGARLSAARYRRPRLSSPEIQFDHLDDDNEKDEDNR